MNTKIYALYAELSDIYGAFKANMRISSEKHWENQRALLENTECDIVKYNSIIWLSFSRTKLVKKAIEIKSEWIKLENEKIKKIEEIQIK